jgi:acyl-lipid omega-6 desaturase (Delta-12 desaturase)
VQNVGWQKSLSPYQKSDLKRSLWQMAHTLIPYVGIWVYLATHLSGPLWITIPLIFIGAGFLVRAFIIFHDCGHNSFFKSRRANEVVGTLLGLLAFTPYHHWRWEHAQHHSTVGDLDNRGIGDLWTMTTKEYLEAPPLKRFGYHIVRNPWFLFGFVPLFLFLVKQRFPAPQAKAAERKTLHLTTVAVIVLSCALSYVFGWKEYLIVQLSILTIAASAGSWLFYIQHQYEDTYWCRTNEWDYFTASLKGSSYYKLPRVLQFFSGNIGYHHVHHLNSKIPNYYLEECQEKFRFLDGARTIGLRESFRFGRVALWDEDEKKILTFKEFKLASGDAKLDSKLADPIQY